LVREFAPSWQFALSCKAFLFDIHTNRVYDEKEIQRGDLSMRRRINVMLPEETVRLIDRVSEKGNRSRLIDEAIKRYVAEIGRAKLRKLLKEGALRRAERDRRLAEEWFLLEEEAWPTQER
jgi:CopG family transcriptional regulator / antitoxin EndoAI